MDLIGALIGMGEGWVFHREGSSTKNGYHTRVGMHRRDRLGSVQCQEGLEPQLLPGGVMRLGSGNAIDRK